MGKKDRTEHTYNILLERRTNHMFYAFFAEGYEETEALGTIDCLKRGGVEVKTVGVYENMPESSHGIAIKMDMLLKDIGEIGGDDILFLPGGVPGVDNLEKSPELKELFLKAHAEGNTITAICAAPSVLVNWGIIEGGDVTCYPSFESKMTGCKPTGEAVTVQGNIIMGRGVGAVFQFGLKILESVVGESEADIIRKQMVV